MWVPEGHVLKEGPKLPLVNAALVSALTRSPLCLLRPGPCRAGLCGAELRSSSWEKMYPGAELGKVTSSQGRKVLDSLSL